MMIAQTPAGNGVGNVDRLVAASQALAA